MKNSSLHFRSNHSGEGRRAALISTSTWQRAGFNAIGCATNISTGHTRTLQLLGLFKRYTDAEA